MSSFKDFLKIPGCDSSTDCGYCSCDCLSSKASSTIKTKRPIANKTETIKPKTLLAKRRSKNLSFSSEELHRYVLPESIDLCESMQNLCSSPRVLRAYNSLSIHDQKILNRMATKRSERIIRSENAWLANQVWQNEKYERDLRKSEQQDAYQKALKEKQDMDSRLMQLRLDELLRQDHARLDELKRSLLLKDILSERRVEKLKHQRQAKVISHRDEELRKLENIYQANNEQLLDNEIRKKNVVNLLERRLVRADSTRQQYLDVYRRRLQADNYREEALHKENYKETLRFENYRREQLQEFIEEKEKKIAKFTEQRRQNFNDRIERAKLSSSLRDLVRRSISPDSSFQISSGRGLHERPLSNLSMLSSIKLG